MSVSFRKPFFVRVRNDYVIILDADDKLVCFVNGHLLDREYTQESFEKDFQVANAIVKAVNE